MRVPESARWCLRVGLVSQCLAAAYLALGVPSPVNGYLFVIQGWSEPVARAVDQCAGALLLVVALGLVLPRFHATRTLAAVTLMVSVWMALVAWATYVDRGHEYAFLAPLAQMVRYVAPLTLVLWCLGERETVAQARRFKLGMWLLRISLAATFSAHGLEALGHHSAFVDLALGGARRVGLPLGEAGANRLLTGIGAMDVLLAVLLVSGRWRWVPAYMAMWGILTAASRMVHSGPSSWPLTLLRAENFMGPLALWMLWSPNSPTEDAPHALDPAPDGRHRPDPLDCSRD